MSVRVSQRSMFTNFVTNMNSSLADLMESNIQASSQKRINKPSDDSIGTARVLNYRDSLSGIEQYKKNIDTAKSWLGLADQTLLQVNTLLTRMKGLAEQAATGTLDANNREQISFELRQQYEQLINLANTQYEGRHLFAGHKTDQPAFVQGLGLTSNDSVFPDGSYSITGAASKTFVVQFTSNATIGGATPVTLRYSTDAGRTWQNGVIAAGQNSLTIDGVNLTMQAGTAVQAVDTTNVHDTLSNGSINGTWLYIRPTAIYKGDDNDLPPTITHFGASPVTGAASGVFSKDVLVRIDSSNASLGGQIVYSYSLDNGNSWTRGNIASSAGTSNSAPLSIPGGFLTLSSNGGNTLAQGDQFIVRPHRGDITFEISRNQTLTVNSIGKDVFGGLYQGPNDSVPMAAYGGDGRNLFETVGRLIGFMESNNQQGIQEALADLDTASSLIMTQAAAVGGRENRLEVVGNVLDTIQLDEKARMSNIEDIDVAELMTKLAQQQLIYNSVLKSSAQIMQMNLTNFI
ncbi:flagellar hook-associated protein FlgL [Desulfovibrio psychrotolerans]|uniref:Flagellar hook-associated protein 3 n=1 Tax=Desulfovibrio psychrotolerans TaxID=415242 RepID=A0A7J0BVS8_9BACT|nr:flagellar hook-associated protein FlgL [Desulfovibrio psychrotolerans]GFM37793.1 flagellar hook-associated protein 3 [Desulfovibrio psychrotolerans]